VSQAADRWRPWWGPVALVLGLIGGNLAGAVVAAVVPGGIVHGNFTPTGTDVATVIQDLAFVGAAVALAMRAGPASAGQFGLLAPRSRWRAVGLVIGALVLVYAIGDAWFSVVGASSKETEFVKDIGGDSGTVGVLAVCALVCVVAPICEEFLFRGFMYRALRNWRGPWPAAIVTGIIFGGVHGVSAPAVDLVPLALLGILLCVVYELSGSLYPCIAVHLINNAIALSGDENWSDGRFVALLAGALALVALVLRGVRLASARWTPATD
jgi:membrane protease YdiL (CAAX protease family)